MLLLVVLVVLVVVVVLVVLVVLVLTFPPIFLLLLFLVLDCAKSMDC